MMAFGEKAKLGRGVGIVWFGEGDTPAVVDFGGCSDFGPECPPKGFGGVGGRALGGAVRGTLLRLWTWADVRTLARNVPSGELRVWVDRNGWFGMSPGVPDSAFSC
jgi:hypothetical protein